MLALLFTTALGAPCLDSDGAASTNPRKTGEAWARQRRFDAALPCFEAATASNPNQWDWSNLGSVHHDLAMSAYTNGDRDLGRTHSEKSIAAFDKAIAMPDAPVQAYLLQGANLALVERQEEGKTMLLDLLARTKAPQARGAIIDRLGQIAEVPFPDSKESLAFKQAFEAGSKAVSPSIETSSGRPTPDEAETRAGILTLDRALRHHPRSWAAWWLKGKGHQALGEQADALNAFQKAYDLHPAHPDVGRELVLTHLKAGNAKDALPRSTEMLRLHPDDPTLLANHALVLLMTGDTKGAQSWVKKSLALAPDSKVTKALEAQIQAVSAGEAKPPERIP